MAKLELFAVRKNFIDSDSDGCQHWLDNTLISYHSSEDNAEAKIKALLQKEIDDIPGNVLLNDHIDSDYWETVFFNCQNNYLSTDEFGEINPIYYVDYCSTED
jgi:hypothetical protein